MISIIVPVYNSERYLANCVQSVLAQEYKNYELILIDDGSLDNSGKLCEEYAARYSRVKTLHTKNNGVSSARNYGIKIANGEFIIFLDSDDRLASNALKIIAEESETSGSDCLIWGISQDKDMGTIWAPEENVTYETQEEFRKNFLQYIDAELLSPSINKLYKKSLIEELFNEKMAFGEDLCFVLDYLQNCISIKFIKDRLYLHNNTSEGSLTKSFKFENLEDAELFQNKILAFAYDEKLNKNTSCFYRKYVFDIVGKLHQMFLSFNHIDENKKSFIKEWYTKSHIKKLDLSIYDLGWKDRIMLFFVKYNKLSLYYNILRLKHKFL